MFKNKITLLLYINLSFLDQGALRSVAVMETSQRRLVSLLLLRTYLCHILPGNYNIIAKQSCSIFPVNFFDMSLIYESIS